MSRVAGPVSIAELKAVVPPSPLVERQHVLAGFRSFPWDRVLPAFELETSLLDVGCGPGLLPYLLQRSGFRGSYLGIDPDPRKIERAKRWPGEDEERAFRAGKVAETSRGAYEQVALLDVLCLVAKPERAAFLATVVRRITPGGLFVAVTSGGGPRWKRAVDGAQEFAAVRLLRITRGAPASPCDGPELAGYLRGAGLDDISVRGIGDGYVHGFELVTARMPG